MNWRKFSDAEKRIAAVLIATIGFVAGSAWADPMPTERADHDNAARPAIPAMGADATRDPAAYVQEKALSLVGIPYRRGGTSPKSGFDCSGFVQYVLRAATGVRIARTAASQAREGLPVGQGQLHVGDLVFFNTLGRKFSHVGLYLGNDQFVHSPSKGGHVRLESLRSPYWQRHYVTGERLKAFAENTTRRSVQSADTRGGVKDVESMAIEPESRDMETGK